MSILANCIIHISLRVIQKLSGTIEKTRGLKYTGEIAKSELINCLPHFLAPKIDYKYNPARAFIEKWNKIYAKCASKRKIFSVQKTFEYSSAKYSMGKAIL